MTTAPEVWLDEDHENILWSHLCQTTIALTGEEVEEVVEKKIPATRFSHMVLQNEPLTIQGKFYCDVCNTSGSVVEGKWVEG